MFIHILKEFINLNLIIKYLNTIPVLAGSN
jgi:hypothetical protein